MNPGNGIETAQIAFWNAGALKHSFKLINPGNGIETIDRISQAIALTDANQGKLPLFSSPTLYTIQTLQQGKEDITLCP